MVQRDPVVRNAARREHLAQQGRKSKSKSKLERRLAIKKAEKEDATGELRRQRLETNVPRTIENTREWVGEDRAIAHDDEKDSDDEEEEDVGVEKQDLGDPRTRPVQIKSNPDGEDDGDIQLDMAGLEALFAHQDAEASTSALPPPHKPILITTSPRPHRATYNFITEFQSLLGGKRFAEFVPRKNARFELSKVCKWAIKRGYGAIVVIGEDLHDMPATMTVSMLPYGPCSHFRLTSVQLHRRISNSANPTSHIPELVLSNFSTPLGLSTGRILQSLFPPLPQIVGRQVVAIHNQRDFIFFRRFRYMFALRETESSRNAARVQGRDEDLRTRMQEIGPRFTLKLRWIKKGPLGEGRRKGGKVFTEGYKGELPQNGLGTSGQDEEMAVEGQSEQQNQQDEEDEAIARQEMLQELGEQNDPIPPDIGEDEDAEGNAVPATTSRPDDPADAPVLADNGGVPKAANATPGNGDSGVAEKPILTEEELLAKKAASKKRKRRTRSPGGTIHIPSFKVPTELPKEELPHHRKLKKGASILDSLSATVAWGRGGTKKSDLEWEWNPRSQVSRRRFAL